jgi:aspartate aminotransferase
MKEEEYKGITPLVSDMVDTLTDSEIRVIAGAIDAMISQGERIFNLTIGDFNPEIFPIPQEFCEYVYKEYKNGKTNYPPLQGEPPIRKVLSAYIKKRENLDYSPEEFFVGAGGRPVIFTYFMSSINPGDKVLVPVPSWNNNYYAHITKANMITVETKPENNFMPKASDLEPHIKDAALLCLCSPSNPTGTTISKEELNNICELVIEENKRRAKLNIRRLYVMYDQMYWQLTFGNTIHYNPVLVNPEMRRYTLFVDGMSKAFAGTGVRVGWGFSDKEVIDKMKNMFSHMGAFPPKPEQLAAADYLQEDENVTRYLTKMRSEIKLRLEGIYEGFMKLKKAGYKVDAIAPQAAIYLTVQFDLFGKRMPDGTVITETPQITSYLLNDAKIGVVPFTAFGSEKNPSWYRISVGTLPQSEIKELIDNLEKSLSKLK